MNNIPIVVHRSPDMWVVRTLMAIPALLLCLTDTGPTRNYISRRFAEDANLKFRATAELHPFTETMATMQGSRQKGMGLLHTLSGDNALSDKVDS